MWKFEFSSHVKVVAIFHILGRLTYMNENKQSKQSPESEQQGLESISISRIIEVEVGVISWSRRLRLITLTKTWIILDITKTESNDCFITHWTEEIKVMFLLLHWQRAAQKRPNLTWLPLEIMHRGHTWHDYPRPRVSLTWLLYNLQLWRHGRRFRKFTVRFRPIGKQRVQCIITNTTGWFICRKL